MNVSIYSTSSAHRRKFKGFLTACEV
uniref:Uncharacterized protein n=1 Tax=Anguilla anguilla TaxID=7936 RepID=A0A0E9QUW0_ANGAN